MLLPNVPRIADEEEPITRFEDTEWLLRREALDGPVAPVAVLGTWRRSGKMWPTSLLVL